MTDLVIARIDFSSGKDQQSTISNINPNVANPILKSFALKTNALSKDSFVKAVRVDKSEL